MTTTRRPMLIDTDTASDDAIALLMALRDPAVDVVAIAVVAGNVPLAQATQNALFTVELAGSAAPVHAGRAAPLARDLLTAEFVHGQDGMGDIGLDLTGREPAGTDAVGTIIDTIRAHDPGTLDLVTLGPLTNIAIAFLQDPSLAARLRSLTVMGGTGDAVGNVSAAAEFNIYVDPEAAAIVFGAGAPLTMVGWDVSRKYAVIDRDDAARIRDLGPLGALAMDINRAVDRFATTTTHLAGFDLPDPIAMAVALDPTIATVVTHRNVVVETAGEHTLGQTVVDHLGLTGREPDTHVVVEASRERFLSMLTDRLRA